MSLYAMDYNQFYISYYYTTARNAPGEYYTNIMGNDLIIITSQANVISYYNKDGIGRTFSQFIE